MILTGRDIESLGLIAPFRQKGRVDLSYVQDGLSASYGCGGASYDVTIAEPVHFRRNRVNLVVTEEHFRIPLNVCGWTTNKSTWFRFGLKILTGFIDPGWHGHGTLSFEYVGLEDSPDELFLRAGTPIAQVVFAYTSGAANPYEGKYQGQPKEVVRAR